MHMVNEACIASWESAKQNRIALPYEDDSYVSQTVYDAVYNTLREQDAEADSEKLLSACDSALKSATVTTLLDLHPSQACPCIGFTVEISLADGQRLEKQIRVNGARDDAIELIGEYFSKGAGGLDDTVRDKLKHLHSDYIRSITSDNI